MFFWNVRALKRALADRSDTRWSSLGYLLALAIAPGLIGSVVSALALVSLLAASADAQTLPSTTIRSAIESHQWMLAYQLCHCAVVAGGLAWCYRRNGGSSGRRFLDSTLALAWVCGVRCWVMVGTPGLVVGSIVGAAAFSERDVGPHRAGAPLLVFTAMSALTLWRVGVHLAELREPAQPTRR